MEDVKNSEDNCLLESSLNKDRNQDRSNYEAKNDYPKMMVAGDDEAENDYPKIMVAGDDGAENDYPKIMVAGDYDIDAIAIQHTSDLHQVQQKDLVLLLPEKDNGALTLDLSESLSPSSPEPKLNSDLHQSLGCNSLSTHNVIVLNDNADGPTSEKRDDFEPPKEQNLTTILESSETRPIDVSLLSQEEGPISPAASSPREGAENMNNDCNLLQSEVTAQNSRASTEAPERIECPKQLEKVDKKQVLIDTAAPFDSVKAVVSKFGGILDWKAHRVQTLERRELIEEELLKAQDEIPIYKKQYQDTEDAKIRLLKQLDSTKRLIEELKLNLERAHTEEQQAKQDSELMKLRVEEMEQGIEDETSTAAKTLLEVARSRRIAAVSELQKVKYELEELRSDYELLVSERERAVERAKEAVLASKEVEKTVEELTIELMDMKESLSSDHDAHLEAEEGRIIAAMDKEKESVKWEKELEKAEEERERLEQKILLKKDLKLKLDPASALLVDLKCELSAYLESKSDQDNEKEGLMKELKEIKLNIDEASVEINCLKMEEASLKLEIETYKSEIFGVRREEEMALVAVTSLEEELSKTKSEISAVWKRERETRERMRELPKQLEQAAQEVDEAKLLAQMAREEWQKQKEVTDHAKDEAKTMETRLIAARKEIEAAKASEKLALAAINALKESENSAQSNNNSDLQEGIITLSLEEYYEMNKQAYNAEEQANMRMASAESQIEIAKESELKTLKKLEDVGLEMVAQKEALVVAIRKAEKAKEGKLCAEQELRMLRAEKEQRRKTGEFIQETSYESKNPRLSFENSNLPSNFIHVAHTVFPQNRYVHGNNAENDSSQEITGTKKKKKSFFPRIFMFLARRKARASKSK